MKSISQLLDIANKYNQELLPYPVRPSSRRPSPHIWIVRCMTQRPHRNGSSSSAKMQRPIIMQRYS